MPWFLARDKRDSRCFSPCHTSCCNGLPNVNSINSLGCKELHAGLMDPGSTVPRRAAKLHVFHTGVDPRGNAVWNGGVGVCAASESGVPYRCALEPLRLLLVDTMQQPKVWDRIHDVYKANKSHVYRQLCANRHGHSNDLPSYFAHGCDTLIEYKDMVSAEEWAVYCAAHQHCCGVSMYVLGQQQCVLAT
eukprot:m.1092900 g.1092900  ORF g.1092900 m.1092900 type:complete len:190 (+) comp24293_c0_seq9:2883-3452(+)